LAVLRALPRDRFDPVVIGIDRAGGFVLVDDDQAEQLRRQRLAPLAIDDRLTVEGRGVQLRSRPAAPAVDVMAANGQGEQLATLDVVFPLMHGKFGEDGVLQGLLETLSVPYVGCGVLASAVGMNKIAMKRALAAEGIPITPHVWFDGPRWRSASGGPRLVDGLRWPLFVKPASMGSSIGVSRVTSQEDLYVAVEQALRWDHHVLVEQGVHGRELECGVLGGPEPEASVVGEVTVLSDWFDYQQKYLSVSDPMVVPALLDPDVAEEIRELSVRAFQAIDGWRLARVDFLYDEQAGKPYVNELNTVPGLPRIRCTRKSGRPPAPPTPNSSYG
jgi:D-alanine-D-alanine ligase